MDEIIAAVIAGVFTIAAVLVGGIKLGSRGKKRGFAKLVTEVEVDGTRWESDFGSGGQHEKAYINFHQHGSRLTGEAQSADGQREWIIEGTVYKGHLCYIYVDTNPNLLSVGAAVLTGSADGKIFEGRWIGWAPEGEVLDPNTVILRKLR